MYSWETLPPGGNDSCLHLGQTMEIYPLPSSESTTYTCTAKNPVSRATSDPIDLGVCSIQQPRDGRWVPALCGLSVLFLIEDNWDGFTFIKNEQSKRTSQKIKMGLCCKHVSSYTSVPVLEDWGDCSGSCWFHHQCESGAERPVSCLI
ncbi:hypothetical protein AAFF_G00206370 [Aldrovandia affinis]|uniref:Ig-like domain-containing protein n=1 Tax=Aldrovandia affinis TaxID=143900 RepID=A0AAD7RHQ9_9TELE|nr:hypothetical protein AAFF_G00206370 [Aldrovandia affinis]